MASLVPHQLGGRETRGEGLALRRLARSARLAQAVQRRQQPCVGRIAKSMQQRLVRLGQGGAAHDRKLETSAALAQSRACGDEARERGPIVEAHLRSVGEALITVHVVSTAVGGVPW